MPLRTVSNTGGNWNATTAWVGGVVPIAGDTVDFTATSGPLVVNVATAILVGIDFTNYVNTITFNNVIQLNTNLNLGTGGYTQAGTSGLSINANTTISGTTVWTRGFLIGANAAVTLTLSNNLNITDLSLNGNLASLSFILGGNILSISNNISFIGNGTYTLNIPQDLQITNLLIGGGGNRTCTINGLFTLSISGNLTENHGVSPVSGTTSIVLNGTGTWSNASTGVIRNNININTTGTITISGNVYYNTGTLTYTAGTVDTTTNNSTLNISTSTTLDTDRGLIKITWNNITITAGTTTLSSNLTISTTFTITGTITGSFTVTTLNLTTGSSVINVTSTSVSGNLTINGSTSGTSPITLNGTGAQTWSHGSAVYLSNNLTINKSSGVLSIGTNVYYNTGTLTYTASTVDATTNNSTLNIGPTTTLNTNGITWNNIVYTGGTTTITLSSNLVFIGTFTITNSFTTTITLAGVGIIDSPNGTLQLTVSSNNLALTTSATHNILNYQFNAGGFAIVSSGTWNVYGNLIRNGISNGRSVTGTINFVGTGSILFNGGSTGAFVGIWNINTSGTLTFGSVTFPNVYSECSIITYISGNVDASNCNLLMGFTVTSQTFTLNTSPINWKNITLRGTNTLLLTSDLNLTGDLTTQTGAITINGLFNVNIGGNLNINFTTSGTATIVLNGTVNQTWSHSSAVNLSNNLTINKSSGTLTVSGNVYYQTGTLTYTAGTVTTTGSTLNISASTTLDTDRGATQIDWNNVITSGTLTITLSSNLSTANLTVSVSSILSFVLGGNVLSVTDNLSIFNSSLFNTPNNLQVTNLTIGNGGGAGNIQINGLFTISVSGNLTENRGGVSACSGTTSIVLNGTGTWSNTSTGSLRNNLTINSPSGTITVSGNVYYQTGTLTYISGTVVTAGSILNITQTTTLDTSGMTWNSVTITVGTQTLTSDLNCQNLTMAGSSNVTINNSGGNVYILGNLLHTSPNILLGTASINLIGTGTWNHISIGVIRNNVNINTSGTITISGNIYYNTDTLTYINGNVITKNSTLNLTAASTLINCHKINFDKVVITSGVNITMNEFFSGSPGFKTTISPSSTTNYTITFQDGFEKFAKFVKVRRTTVSTPGQLTVITDKGNQGNNVGVKFAPNQITNGLPKNSPSVNTAPTNGLPPSYLVIDPTLS